MSRNAAKEFLAAVKHISPIGFPSFSTATSWCSGIGHAVVSRVRRVRNRDGWTCRSSLARLELRDARLLIAMMAGRLGVSDDLVFPSQAGTVIKPDNIVPRYMEPALEQAGLRRFRFHDLRHTFGSLLIQDGASLAWVHSKVNSATECNLGATIRG
jgi:integrase